MVLHQTDLWMRKILLRGQIETLLPVCCRRVLVRVPPAPAPHRWCVSVFSQWNSWDVNYTDYKGPPGPLILRRWALTWGWLGNRIPPPGAASETQQNCLCDQSQGARLHPGNPWHTKPRQTLHCTPMRSVDAGGTGGRKRWVVLFGKQRRWRERIAVKRHRVFIVGRWCLMLFLSNILFIFLLVFFFIGERKRSRSTEDHVTTGAFLYWPPVCYWSAGAVQCGSIKCGAAL